MKAESQAAGEGDVGAVLPRTQSPRVLYKHEAPVPPIPSNDRSGDASAGDIKYQRGSVVAQRTDAHAIEGLLRQKREIERMLASVGVGPEPSPEPRVAARSTSPDPAGPSVAPAVETTVSRSAQIAAGIIAAADKDGNGQIDATELAGALGHDGGGFFLTALGGTEGSPSPQPQVPAGDPDAPAQMPAPPHALPPHGPPGASSQRQTQQRTGLSRAFDDRVPKALNRDHVVTIPTKGKPRSHKAVVKAIFEREKVRSIAKQSVFFLCLSVRYQTNRRPGKKREFP